MKNDETTKELPGEPDATEGKRTAARRRFLRGSAAAGTGIFVVTTFHHQRAVAGGKKIMTSSAATCLSLHGTPGKQTTVKDKSTGNNVSAIQCTVPK